MNIIPVIDLKSGQVVHAKMGLREEYRPVNSQICRNADPIAIVQAFLELLDFEIIYVADLDAIAGNSNNNDIILDINHKFPCLKIWLDTGASNINDFQEISAIIPVYGSETGHSLAALNHSFVKNNNLILSLDYKNDQFLGDELILKNNNCWPENVIVMNLSRVGSSIGPDFHLLEKIRQQAGNRKVYCGGGIRTLDDLQQLVNLGLDGVLTATAIHNKIIDKNILLEIQ